MKRILGKGGPSAPQALTIQADTQEELEQAIGHYAIRGFNLALVRRSPSGEWIADLRKDETP